MNKVLDMTKAIKEKYYEPDIWDLTKHPDEEIAVFFNAKLKKYRSFDFTKVESQTKRNELKTYFKALFEGKANISYKGKYMTSYFLLLDFANFIVPDSFLGLSTNEIKEQFEEFLAVNNKSKFLNVIIANFYITLLELLDERKGFDRDLWHLDELSISKERYNAAAPIKVFNFRCIKNSQNRDYVKTWVRYMLGCTEYAISTIFNNFQNVSIFLNELEDLDASDITSDDVDIVLDLWTGDRSNANINKILGNVNSFYKYFEVREGSHIKSPIQKNHFLSHNYVPADNLVSENVILQIYRKIHLLPFQEMVMLLINITTGLRISDICQIKADCLYYDNNDGYYINCYCQKMQKIQDNQIAPALYEKIQQQQEAVRGKSKYLFPSLKSNEKPMNKCVFANHINKWVKEYNILNDDGTLYRYKSHAYRHTLATDLIQNYNADIQVVQIAVLHHQELQMTLTYAQRGDNFNKAKHDKYISNYGEFEPFDFSDENTLQKRALGNGYCGINTEKMAACPYEDACIDCQFFRTSKSFLDIHKMHLAEVQKNIVTCKANGWVNNLATELKKEKTLIRIIKALETIE